MTAMRRPYGYRSISRRKLAAIRIVAILVIPFAIIAAFLSGIWHGVLCGCHEAKIEWQAFCATWTQGRWYVER